MSRFHIYDKSKILELLHLLDDKLTADYCIQLCGTAAVLLQDYDFRLTRDIDFAKPVDNICGTVILRVLKDNPMLKGDEYDTQAPGVVCLLEDYEDRLVEIKDNFKHLRVFVLSIVDWMVSKLEAPKFDDLLNYPHFITKERLDFIENNMGLYCGLVEERAWNSLKILKNELNEIEEIRQAMNADESEYVDFEV